MRFWRWFCYRLSSPNRCERICYRTRSELATNTSAAHRLLIPSILSMESCSVVGRFGWFRWTDWRWMWISFPRNSKHTIHLPRTENPTVFADTWVDNRSNGVLATMASSAQSIRVNFGPFCKRAPIADLSIGSNSQWWCPNSRWVRLSMDDRQRCCSATAIRQPNWRCALALWRKMWHLCKCKRRRNRFSAYSNGWVSANCRKCLSCESE